MFRDPRGWDTVAAKRQTQCRLSNARAGSRYCRFSRTWRCFLERLDRGKHAGIANTHRESHRDNLREPVRQSFQPDQEHPQSAPCLERCVDRHVAIPESNRRARIARRHRSRSSRKLLWTALAERILKTPSPDLSNDAPSTCQGLRQSCRCGTEVPRRRPGPPERRPQDAVRS